MNLFIATEDELSEAVVERLVEASGNPWVISVKLRKNGYGYLKTKLNELIITSNKVPVFLLTDLDRCECAPTLIRDWTGEHKLPPGMRFRVAVREIEAWLMADIEGISEFLQIPASRFPDNPESSADPKCLLLNLVKKYGTRAHKAELLPAAKARAAIGLGYNALLTSFVRNTWDPDRAAIRSDSLARAMRGL